MNRQAISLLTVVLASVAAVANASEDTASVESSATAEQLVRDAVEAKLSGEKSRSDALLAEAAALDPDYGPAHWHRGRLKFEGEWRSVDEVAKRVARDNRWREYNELRQSMAGTPADHAELARWCMRNGLENEERIHWTKVLRADPSHDLARTRLDVREYGDGLYTEAQIAEHEQRMGEFQAAFQKFKPVFAALCQRVLEDESTGSEAALSELAKVDDPAAIPALENATASAAEQASPQAAKELRRSLVMALANIPDHLATQRLLYHSVMADDGEIRQLAARSLAPRPVTDYVPQLMAALSAPIEAIVASVPVPGGGAKVGALVYQAGPLADFRQQRVVQIAAKQINGSGNGPRTIARNRQIRDNAKRYETAARQQIASANMSITIRNQRIREVLFNSTGVDFGPNPQNYWDEWTSYNDLYIPEHPVISLENSFENYNIPTMSCFARGTPVWTQAGAVPIEEVSVGDLVLAQNSETGELSYREVMERTVRPITKMARVSTGDSTVDATLGHRFWVNGKGWVMTKFLEEGHALHTLAGPAELTSLQPLPPEELTEAYNLVVDDFHTYVVGKARVVVHDNTCPKPITAKTPGLKPAKAKFERPLAQVSEN